jgi:hypothetical protein
MAAFIRAMSANQRTQLGFDPYKRPPAARLLAVLIISLLLGWLLRTGDRSQLAQFHRDPAKYAAQMDRIARHGLAFDIIASLMVVTAIVFAVDAVTSLLGRWLTERELPKQSAEEPAAHPPMRADALLGSSTAPPLEG